MSDFIQGHDKKWPEKTNIYCSWCCHPFDNIPCGIPEKYIKGIFYLTDCFCSFNCTASYILNVVEYKKWEKYSLLNLLYSNIYGETNKIELALDKRILNVFGGYMSIDEYRKNIDIIDKKHNILFPPLVSIIPKVEILKNNCVINNENNKIPNEWDFKEVKKTQSINKNINSLANNTSQK